MGIFQRYIKTDTKGKPVMGKNGKPVRKGPWFIQYPYERDPQTGKVKYRTEKASFGKKKAEKMFRTKCDAFQEMEKFGVQIDTEMTFRDLIDWGLKQEVMKSKVSASDDLARAVHLETYFGDSKAVQITPLNVDNFRIKMKQTVSERTKKPFSGSTINKMVSLARRIYYLGMDQGIVKSNPFARRGAFKEEPKGQYIPEKEFWMIYKFLPDYLKPLILVAYLTGMRRGEIIELEWDRVDLIECFIDLTPDDTKTEEPRRIYFNSIKILKDVFIEAGKKRKSGHDLVFTKLDGSPVPKWYIQRLLKQACQDAGVNSYRLHDFRHTFNTNMTKAGVDQVTTMKLTGHKTNSMFIRYSHLDREQGEGAMDKLSGFLSLKN
jgi:integrase